MGYVVARFRGSRQYKIGPMPRLRVAALVGSQLFRRFLPLHQFHVQAERLQLAHQNVERFWNARLDARLSLDDGLVNFCAAVHVVRFCGKQFLENVRRAVRFERPDFHFAESLAAELRLAAERLLGNERVRPDRPRVDFSSTRCESFGV